MCGICVWLDRKGDVRGERLLQAVNLMRHRGPDAQRITLWPDPCGDPRKRLDSPGSVGRLGLGHARLSIIDLSEAAYQPMLGSDGCSSLVFNGEIYNYLELGAALPGPSLRTRSDSEVLLEGLLRKGLDFVRQLNGMWAFALCQPAERRLVLSRDRFGKKPLYYYSDGERFLAASEFRAIAAMLGRPLRLNTDFLYGFLMGKRWPVLSDTWETAYREVRVLPPGAVLSVDLDTLEEKLKILAPIEEEFQKPCAPEALPELLSSAVRLRLRSDVPVGVMLSGGVDSTAVAAAVCADPAMRDSVRFYSIATEGGRDLQYARKVADRLGIELIEAELEIDESETRRVLMEMLRHFEAPVGLGLVSLPGYLLCRRMAADGVRVVLDGTGGDEIMGGYPNYFALAMQRACINRKLGLAVQLNRILQRRGHSEALSWGRLLRRTLFPAARHGVTKAMGRRSILEPLARRADSATFDRLLDIAFPRDTFDEVRDYQTFDLTRGQMPYYLHLNDRNSMAHSMELRSPLLDYRLARYVNQPLEDKMRDGYNKHLLRMAIPSVVGNDVRLRRDKAGFSSLPATMRDSARPGMLAVVRESSLLNELFQMDGLCTALELQEAKSKNKTLLHQLYSVALFEQAAGGVV
ncbi:MAG: asparagine synthase (glutamine-hydrolyzing) [Desulfovibrionaceae bacterium]